MSANGDKYSKLLLYIKNSLGYATINELAQAMNKRPNTLVNNLRYLAEHQNYRSKFTKQFSSFLDIPLQELGTLLEKLFNQEENDSKETVKYLLEERYNILASSNHDNYKFFTKLIDGLEKNDQVFIVINNRPLEYDDEILQNKIKEALIRGVSFFYVHPNTKHYPALRPYSPSVVNGNLEFNGYRKKLYRLILDSEWANKLAIKYSNEALIMLIFISIQCASSEEAFIINPFHNYFIVKSGNEAVRPNYVLESINTGSPIYPTQAVYMQWNPLPLLQCSQIFKWTNTLLSSHPQIDISDETRQLIKELGLENLLSLNFIKRPSKIKTAK